MTDETVDKKLFIISFLILVSFIFALNTGGYAEDFFENIDIENPFSTAKTFSIHGDLDVGITGGSFIYVKDFTVEEGEHPLFATQKESSLCIICIIDKVKENIYLYDNPDEEPISVWNCRTDELTFWEQVSPIKSVDTCNYQFDGLTEGTWYVGGDIQGYVGDERLDEFHIRTDIKKIVIEGEKIEITDDAELELLEKKAMKDVSMILILLELFAGIMFLAFISSTLKNIGSPEMIAMGVGTIFALTLIYYIHSYQWVLHLLPTIAATGSIIWIIFFGFGSFIVVLGTILRR